MSRASVIVGIDQGTTGTTVLQLPDRTAPTIFHPRMPLPERERIVAGWREALAQTTGGGPTS